MEKPWEIVQKFQQRINPASILLNVRQNKSPPEQMGVVQHFLPTTGLQDVALRIRKIKDVVNESTRFIDESRPRALNNTTISFCQNCSCANCLNQSSILGPDNNSHANISELVQAFELFINTQRQQFMQMMNQVASVMDTSSCATINSLSSAPQPTPMECDSSVKSKLIENGSVPNHKSPSICAAQDSANSTKSSPYERPSSTMQDSSSAGTKVEGTEKVIEHNFRKIRSPEKSFVKKADSNFNDKSSNKQNFNDIDCDFDSFLDYEDTNFRPLRKSSFEKSKNSSQMEKQISFNIEVEPANKTSNCSVLLEDINSKHTEQEKKKQAKGRKKIADSTTLSSKGEVTSNSVGKSKDTGIVSENTNTALRTRSGRTVLKPAMYWLNKTQNEKSQSTDLETKSGERKESGRRTESSQSMSIPETNGKKQSRIKKNPSACNSMTLKTTTKVAIEESEKSKVDVSKKRSRKAKAAVVRGKASHKSQEVGSSCDSGDREKGRKVQPMLKIDLNSQMSNVIEKEPGTNSTKLEFAKDNKIKDKGVIELSERKTVVPTNEVPTRVKGNKLVNKDSKKQAKNAKRKNHSTSNSTLSKRQKLTTKLTSILSTDSMEPEYECYFGDERTDSWLEA